MLYENAVDSQQTLISTTQWAIGLLAAVVFAVFGTQLFFNYRIGKKDVDNLTGLLQKGLADNRAESAEVLSTRITQLRVDLRSEFGTQAEQIAQLRAELRAELAAHGEQLNQMRTELRADIDNSSTRSSDGLTRLREELQNQIRAESSVVAAKLSELKKEHEGNDKLVDRRLDDLDARLWETEGVIHNALTNHIKGVLHDLDLGWDASTSLKHVIRILEQVTFIYDVDVPDVEALIKRLPKQYSEQLEKIKKRFKELPVTILNAQR